VDGTRTFARIHTAWRRRGRAATLSAVWWLLAPQRLDMQRRAGIDGEAWNHSRTSANVKAPIFCVGKLVQKTRNGAGYQGDASALHPWAG
jgi:hypothetical protein